ncbi:hypothetical protein [Chitinophaga tropicalis]|uniref:Uncharacterized protein n=1 Tax=Chitinophaga tropicalis TaxID=2683588 RepID=A0A7K1TXC7_9BACT|nr:hypothetical protein [Chitinophaga tropicalis]MVT06759.1 hypothetical protein [Chitinophaga tropicalis]
MEDLELREIWAAYDRKLEKSLALNKKLITEIQTQKVRSLLRALIAGKIAVIITGSLWAIFLASLVSLALIDLTPYSLFFIVSAVSCMLFSLVAVIVYIRHIMLIQEIDNSNSIIETQKRLAVLQTTTLKIVRASFLTAPFYTVFYLNENMFRNGNIGLWILQASVTAFFIFGAIWLYRNTTMANAHKSWFKLIFNGNAWISVNKAIDFLEEIEAYEKE